jgi:outer membrane protein assembly factor BamB
MPRRDKQEPVVFDLVGDSGPDGAPEAGGGGRDASAGEGRRFLPRLPRLPGLSRRAWVVVAAVVAAVALTTAAVDLVRDHRRQELMRTSAVGVASLADPPEETWFVPFDVAAEPGREVHQQLVTMDGLLVLPPGPALDYWIDASSGVAEAADPPGFEDVVAVDPGSGDVAWRVPVGEDPTCAPIGYAGSISSDVLVCVQGPGGAREVLTIGPDGSTRVRPADPAEGEQVFPGPDGTVVRTLRAGGPAGEADCDPLTGCPPEAMAKGHDLLVTAEDARTGAERWSDTVEFDPALSYSCQAAIEPGGSPTESAFDLDVVTVRTGAETVVVEGCGVSATFSTPGARLDLAGGTELSPPVWVSELGSGRFALADGPARSVVVDAAGEILRTLQGTVQAPAVSPDAPDDLAFVTSSSDPGFEAVREDGSVAWTERYATRVALAGRDVVVADRGNRLVGLDRETGTELWSWTNDDPSGLTNTGAFTDGEAVAVEYLAQDDAAQGKLVGLDLDTGEQLWDVPMTGMAVAGGGHLVELAPEGVRGLG